MLANPANATWDQDDTIYVVVGQNSGNLANLTLASEYKYGSGQGDACHSSPDGSFGNISTDGSGNGRVLADQSGITQTGVYTICPNDGTLASNHRNFTISSL